ncbi:MAG: MFS transporter [Lachnospiraceae bacterium]|nr:MFS transporter [Lachnospiraceae bacterium]
MKIHRHYAWLICFACMMLFFCGIGFSTTAISVYFPFLKEHMDLSNTQISMISTARTFVSTAAMLLAPFLYRKISLRTGTLLSMSCLAVSRVIFGLAPNVWFYYVAAAFMGITYSWGVMYPVMIYLNNWFEDRYATAAGIATCGSGVCTILMPPVVTFMIGHLGLKISFLIETGFVVLITVMLYLILRDTPAEKGLEKYREEVTVAKKETNSVKQLQRLPGKHGLWMVTLSAFLVGIVAAPSTANYAIHYATIGYTGAVIATAMSLYGAVNFAGKLVIGWSADRFRMFFVNLIFLGIFIAASFSTAMLGGALATLMIATSLNGLGTPMATLGIGNWSRDLTDAEGYRGFYSRNQMLFTIGSLIGAPVPGIIADAVGSYRPVYMMFGILLSAALVLVNVVYLHCMKQKDGNENRKKEISHHGLSPDVSR